MPGWNPTPLDVAAQVDPNVRRDVFFQDNEPIVWGSLSTESNQSIGQVYFDLASTEFRLEATRTGVAASADFVVRTGTGPTERTRWMAAGGSLFSTFISLAEEAGDPGAVANRGHLYAKDVSGITQLFYQASDGTVGQLTPSVALTAFIQGGNSFGVAAVLGTNDAFNLEIETGGVTRMTLLSTGAVLVNKAVPVGTEQLGVAGDIRTTLGNMTLGRDRGYLITDDGETGTVNAISLHDGSNILYIGRLPGTTTGTINNILTYVCAAGSLLLKVGTDGGTSIGVVANLVPDTDEGYIVGSSAKRFFSVNAGGTAGFQVFATVSAANPVLRANASGLSLGAGGATPLSWNLAFLSADKAGLASGDSLRIGTDGSTGVLEFGASGDAAIYRGAANELYLATGDSLNIVSGSILGTYTLGGTPTLGVDITFSDGVDIAIGSVSGTKIGTATTQLLGFWNTAPVDQPAAVTSFTDNSTGTPSDTIADAGLLYSQAGENDFRASVASKINTILSRIREPGVIAT